MDLEIRKKKLLFRAHHRGFKEADLILGGFADVHVPAMDASALDAFERLLSAPDQDLYGWIVGNSEAPADFEPEMLERVRQFGYSDRPVND